MTSKGSERGAGLEGEIAVEVNLRLFELAAATDAWLLIRATRPRIAKGTLAIELLFQAAKGLVDRFSAFESNFNHEVKSYRKVGARGSRDFYRFFWLDWGKREDFSGRRRKRNQIGGW